MDFRKTGPRVALILALWVLPESSVCFAAEPAPPADDPFIRELPAEYFYAPASTDLNAPPPGEENSASTAPEGTEDVSTGWETGWETEDQGTTSGAEAGWATEDDIFQARGETGWTTEDESAAAATGWETEEYDREPVFSGLTAPPPEENGFFAPTPQTDENLVAGTGLGRGMETPLEIESGLRAAQIAEATLPADRGKLLGLAKKFVDMIGKGFQRAEDELAKSDAGDQRLYAYLDAMPDGETLIFDVTLTKMKNPRFSKLKIPEPVTALKRGRDLLVSLREFVAMASFAIKVMGDDGIAEGWFMRENQPFRLDIKAGKVLAGQKAFPLPANDVFAQDGDILVSWKLLAQWFGAEIRPNVQTQKLEIRTAQAWPPQEADDRRRRLLSRRLARLPKLPFRKEPYDLAAVPNADIHFSYSTSRTERGFRKGALGHSVGTQGDLAGFSMRSRFSGSPKEPVQRLTASFSRQSEKAELLGPLRARFFEFNDIQTVVVPGAGTGGQERGVHVTNVNPQISYDTATQIDGTAPPGWDVEVFRDEQFIQGGTADLNGRFVFSNVTLFAGDNRFHIIKYGPVGEIQEEFKTISVAPGAYGESGLYNVSLSQQNTQTYTNIASTDTDKDTLHLAATYEKQLTDSLVFRKGVRIRDEGGRPMFYMHDGIVKSLHGVILNADLTQNQDGAFTSYLTARTPLGKDNVFGMLSYTTDDYHPGIDGDRSTIGSLTASAGLVGKRHWRGRDIGFEWRESMARQNTGVVTTTSDLGLSSRIGRLQVNNDLRYNTAAEEGGGDRFLGTLAVRGRSYGTQWRTSTDYDLRPETRVRRTSLGLSRLLDENLYSSLQFDRALFPTKSSDMSASLSWHRKREVITSSVSHDFGDNLSMLVNVSFGLAYDPHNGTVVRSAQNLTSFGGVSAFVFLDKEGDGKFTEGDEPLEGATIEAVQSRLTVETDKKGEAFLHNLPTNEITDIQMQENSAFEPDWVPGFKGVSIRPRPGHIARLVFPIWRGGQMDGTAYIRFSGGARRPLSSVRLYLYDADGRLQMASMTAPDGYFIFEKIVPGKYVMVADSADLKESKALPALPQPIAFGFEGTTLFGQDIDFEASAGGEMSLSISPDMSDFLAANPGIKVKDADKSMTVMNLGSFHTRLLATLVWYKLKTYHPALVAGATPMVKPAEINNSAKTGLHTLRLVLQGGGARDAYARCREISAAGFTCGVEILPKGLQTQAEVAGSAGGKAS